jgi:hypothetical protein
MFTPENERVLLRERLDSGSRKLGWWWWQKNSRNIGEFWIDKVKLELIEHRAIILETR